MKFISIALTVILFRSLTVSAGVTEDCSGWEEHQKRFYKVDMNSKYWPQARDECKRLAGRLVILRDDSAVDFIISDVVMTKYFYYWFGMSVINGKKTWVNGTVLDKSYNNKWESGTKVEDNFCASRMWRSRDDKWRLEPCSSSRNYVCEAETPCEQTPAISVGGGGLEKGNITIIMEQRLPVRCFANGYHGRVVKSHLNCPWKNISVVKPEPDVIATIHFDAASHMENCECTVYENRDTKQAVTLTFIFNTSPLFVNSSDNHHRIFTVLIGHGFNQTFDIIANPYPTFFELTFNKTAVDADRYNVSTEPLDERFHIRVTMSLFELSLSQSGPYVFEVDNHVGDPLESSFTLDVVKELKRPPPKEKDTGGGIPLSYLLVLGLALLVILLILGVVWKSRKGMVKSDNMAEEASQDIQQESEAPIPEMESINMEDNVDGEELIDMASASFNSAENVEIAGSYRAESTI